MTKFEMLRDSLREIRESIENLNQELEWQCPETWTAYRQACAMEEKIMAEMERTE